MVQYLFLLLLIKMKMSSSVCSTLLYNSYYDLNHFIGKILMLSHSQMLCCLFCILGNEILQLPASQVVISMYCSNSLLSGLNHKMTQLSFSSSVMNVQHQKKKKKKMKSRLIYLFFYSLIVFRMLNKLNSMVRLHV